MFDRQTARTPATPATAPDRPPRILILWASIGNGHRIAAEAIEAALRQVRPDAVVRSEDVLSLAILPIRFGYSTVYLYLAQHAPAVLGYLYGLMDRVRPPSQESRLYRLKVELQLIGFGRLLALLRRQPWDLVINTFFLSTEVVASQRRKGRFGAPQVQVITDYESHGNWVNPPCELYCTATEEAALYLQCYGVPPAAAANTGIPVHPVYSTPKDRAACRTRHGLVGDRPVVLLLGGGHGVGHLEQAHQTLLRVPHPLEIVTVTGWNAAARQRLAALPPPPQHRVKLFGYTNQMDELFAAADLVVTKPGGLTTAEALARGTPLVVINPVPGQEERNSDYLLENGAAIKVNHLPTLPHKLTELLSRPRQLAQLQANARRLGRPRAAFDVAERSLALIPWLAPAVGARPETTTQPAEEKNGYRLDERGNAYGPVHRLHGDGGRHDSPVAVGQDRR